MKKLTFVAAMAIAAATVTSCGNSTPKAKLKSDVDSLSYAVGMAQSEGVKDYLMRQDIDSTYIKEFVKGLNDGAKAGDNKKKMAYYMGVQIGQMMSNQWIPGFNRQVFGEDSTQTMSLNNMLAGFVSGAVGTKGLMTAEQARMLAQTKMQQLRKQTLEKQYASNKKKGEDFLAENAKKPGIKALKSGVQYKVIKEGTGAIPADTSKVVIHYEGRTVDGKVFDSSYERKEPAKTQANYFIKGFTDALVHMPAGSVWEVYIPQELAYGEQEMREIKPFSALIFKIELISVNGK